MAARRYLTALFDHYPGFKQPVWRSRRRPAGKRTGTEKAMAIDVGALTGGWGYGAASADGAVWRATRRHSRVVSGLRLVLPAIAFVVVAWMFISARTLPTDVGDIDLGDVGLEGTTLTMQNPSLSGFNEDGTGYQVTAAKALQDVTNPRTVTLESVDGTMTKPDGSKVRVTADNGVFDSEEQWLELSNNIVVATDKGDHAYLNAARVDMKAGTIVSDEPVRAKANSGSIRAKSMEITDSGAHLLFKGKVVVELRLDGGPVEGSDAVEEQAPAGKNGADGGDAEIDPSEETPDNGQ
jgi:lipopolysaccharide export system protein LptC